MITSLPADTYYRGYRLSSYPGGHTHIYYGEGFISSENTREEAKKTVDNWLEAL